MRSTGTESKTYGRGRGDDPLGPTAARDHRALSSFEIGIAARLSPEVEGPKMT